MKINSKLFVPLFALAFIGCEDYLDVDPVGNTLTQDEALQTPQDYENILNSCYDVIANYKNGRLQVLNDLLSDDLDAPNASSDYNEVYNRNMLFFNGTIGGVYGEPYIAIMRANSLIDALSNGSAGVDDARKQVMEAECRFIRALGHFDVVTGWAQPYGFSGNNEHPGIAIRTSVDIQSLPPRESVGVAYAQIISDLEFAKDNLPNDNGSYASKYAAEALLAKVYFQMNDHATAKSYADAVINSGVFSLDPGNSDTLNRFREGDVSSEAIFWTVSQDNDQRSGAFTGNYRTDLGNEPTLRVSQELYALFGTDTADQRSSWLTVFNEGAANEYIGLNKFNRQYFSVPVLHLTDLHLLRAECAALIGTDLTVAINDVNALLERAFGDNSRNLGANASAQIVLDEIHKQRRIEMVGEGNRIQQQKRRGASGEAIIIRNAPWDCNGMVLQFPISEQTDIFPLNQTGGC